MAEDGSSVWGAGMGGAGGDEDLIGESSRASLGSNGTAEKPAPRLFDDLGDAGWGSPEMEDTDKVDGITADEAPGAQTEEGLIADGSLDVLDQTGGDDGADFDDVEAGNLGDGDGGVDDDFGDFGDFEDNAEDGAFDEEEKETSVAATAIASTRTSSWRPLQLGPNMTSASLARDIRQLLSAPSADGREYPFHDGAASQLSQDKIRQVDGAAQLLVSDDSRKIWDTLTSQPNLKPVDWLRSKTRRQYLIAIGVPINLDELNAASSNVKALPPLALKLDGKADDDSTKNGDQGGRDGGKGFGRPAKDRESSKPPEFDVEHAKKIIAMTEDQLTLQSLPALKTLQREVETLTKQASRVLTFHLSQRENHAADAEMYNGLIRDLVTGAAKRVGASNAQGGVARKASMRVASGRSSPAPGIAANASVRSSSPRT